MRSRLLLGTRWGLGQDHGLRDTWKILVRDSRYSLASRDICAWLTALSCFSHFNASPAPTRRYWRMTKHSGNSQQLSSMRWRVTDSPWTQVSYAVAANVGAGWRCVTFHGDAEAVGSTRITARAVVTD